MTFGAMVTNAQWPILRAAKALTTVTLNILGPDVVDPVTGAMTQTNIPVSNVDALRSDYSGDEIDGVIITKEDEKLIIPKSETPLDPNLLSTVTYNGVTKPVKKVREVNNGGAWALQVSRVGHV